MSRKDRRRDAKQAKAGRTGPASGVPAGRAAPPSVSDLLLGRSGATALPALDEASLAQAMRQATAISPVERAFAATRRRREQEQQAESVEAALQRDPESVALLLVAARLRLLLNQHDAALAAYRRILALDPDQPEARHMVAALGGGGLPAMPDETYVAELFDRFADSFDTTLVHWLEYKGPQVTHQAALAALGPEPGPLDILDLGCGTGLNGPLFRPLARRLDGVDLSPRMIDKARTRGVYDELAVDEAVRFLNACPRRYDLALATDVLCYFGDLAAVLPAACRVLRSGGHLVATFEIESGQPFALGPSGRYAHSDAYVRERAAAAGFQMVSATDAILRTENQQPVREICYVLRNPVTAA